MCLSGSSVPGGAVVGDRSAPGRPGAAPGRLAAAAAISVGGLVLGAGHLLRSTTFDLPVWALLCWLIFRISPRACRPGRAT